MSKTSKFLLYALLGLFALLFCCGGIWCCRRRRRPQSGKGPKGGLSFALDTGMLPASGDASATSMDGYPPDGFGDDQGGAGGRKAVQIDHFDLASHEKTVGFHHHHHASARHKFESSQHGNARKNVVAELADHVDEYTAVTSMLMGVTTPSSRAVKGVNEHESPPLITPWVDRKHSRRGSLRRTSVATPLSALSGHTAGTPADPQHAASTPTSIFLAGQMPNASRPIVITGSKSVHGTPSHDNNLLYARPGHTPTSNLTYSQRQYKNRPQPLKFASLRENSTGNVHPPSAPTTPFSAGFPSAQLMECRFLANGHAVVNPTLGTTTPTGVFHAQQRRVSADLNTQAKALLSSPAGAVLAPVPRAKSYSDVVNKLDRDRSEQASPRTQTESQSLPPKRRRPPTYKAPPSFDHESPAIIDEVPSFEDLVAFEAWQAERAKWAIQEEEEYISVGGCDGTRVDGHADRTLTNGDAAMTKRPPRETNWGSSTAEGDDDYLPIDGAEDGDIPPRADTAWDSTAEVDNDCLPIDGADDVDMPPSADNMKVEEEYVSGEGCDGRHRERTNTRLL